LIQIDRDNPMFTRIHHVSIAVRSLEQALAIYRDVLGLPEAARATVVDQGVRAVLLAMPDAELELLEPADPSGGVARFLERRGEGLHHLCLETPDVAAALAHAKRLALPMIDQSSRPGLAGMIAFLHPKASNGILVEFAQPPAPPEYPEPAGAGIQALGLRNVYAVVKDLSEAAITQARNFHAKLGSVQENVQFGAKQIEISIGNSQITLLSPTDGRSPAGCFLADRGEGLFGVCLRVMDLEAALLYLECAGISTEVDRQDASPPLARLDLTRTHGVNLFLCPDTPRR
jgi:methylmalonyl-CoA/ethylmalonyl-CoA epimerase